MAFLGIDLGTSGLRALLTDDEGAPVASAERHYEVSHLHSGWSEQDPADWIAALDAAVEELKARPEWPGLRGIGVAGHMHGATLLDDRDRVIRPCILWNDTRSFAEAATLDATPRVRDLSGNIVFPGFTAPKLEWLRTHEPEAFARTARVLLPAAYLNWYLTGDHVADMSDSAGTSWLDVGGRDWSELLLSAGHMRRDQMPRLVEGCDAAGTLRAELATRWGVGTVIVAGRETMPRRPAAPACCGKAKVSSRSGPPACCSLPATAIIRTRTARCTPSATRCRGSGTRWG